MPKLLVLFHDVTGSTAALADAVAAGARSVRFTEVDVRRVGTPDSDAAAVGDGAAHAELPESLRRYRVLAAVEQVAEYDAIAIGMPGGTGDTPPAIRELLDAAAALPSRGALTDRVTGLFTSGPASADGDERALWWVLNALAAMGTLLVPPDRPVERGGGSPIALGASEAPDEDDRARARQYGARLARVADWVRHAKGHEAAAGGPHHHHGGEHHHHDHRHDHHHRHAHDHHQH